MSRFLRAVKKAWKLKGGNITNKDAETARREAMGRHPSNGYSQMTPEERMKVIGHYGENW